MFCAQVEGAVNSLGEFRWFVAAVSVQQSAQCSARTFSSYKQANSSPRTDFREPT